MMFRKLVDKAAEIGFQAAVRRGLVCPSCGTKAQSQGLSPSQAIRCGHCGTSASWVEWVVRPGAGQAAVNPDEPPPGTKITREPGPDAAVVWNIPASGRSGGLMVFGVLWCLITAGVSFPFLFSTADSRPAGLAMLGIVAFLLVFWAVGIGMLYAAFRNKYATHRLAVDRSTVTLRRQCFGRTTDKSLAVDAITSIAQVEFYQRNYQPVHGIEIKGRGGKLRFGSVLGDDEKAWLVADLRRVVSGGNPALAPAPRAAEAVARQSHVSVVVPKSGNFFQATWVLAVMGLAFVALGIFVIRPEPTVPSQDAPGAVRIFDAVFSLAQGGFRLAWLAMSGLMATLGIAGIVWQRRAGRGETRVEATDGEVAVRVVEHGRVVLEKVVLPRAELQEVRCFASGSSNGRPMKRVELIFSGRIVPLLRWCDAEQADPFADELRRALLGVASPSAPQR